MTFLNKHMDYDVTIVDGKYASVESGWDIHGTYPTVPIMQYTGLLDKNWVEIYENDIVRYDLDWDWEIRLAVVPQLTPKARHRYWELQSLVDDWYYIEIIGNIYQNPELLN